MRERSARTAMSPTGDQTYWDEIDAARERFYERREEEHDKLVGPLASELVDDGSLEPLPEGRTRRFFTTKQLGRPVKIDWLVDGWIAAGELSVIYGQGDRFKSFLALHWGLSAARAGRSVVYIAGEGAHGLRSRIPAWMKHHDVKHSELRGFRVDEQPVMVNTRSEVSQWLNEIESELEGSWPDWVIIDTLAMNFSGDENAPSDMADFVRGCERLRRREDEGHRTGVTVIHHTVKAGNVERGSQGVRNASFSMVCLKDKNGNTVGVHCDRMKDAPRPSSVKARLVKVELGTDRSSLAVASLSGESEDLPGVDGRRSELLEEQLLTIAGMKGRITRSRVAEELDVNVKRAEKVLTSAVKRKVIVRQRGGGGRATGYRVVG